jgi:hypothetical protein
MWSFIDFRSIVAEKNVSDKLLAEERKKEEEEEYE